LEFVTPTFRHMCKTIHVKEHIKVVHVKAYLSISYIHGFGPKYSRCTTMYAYEKSSPP
jgi:hypothetical protein